MYKKPSGNKKNLFSKQNILIASVVLAGLLGTLFILEKTGTTDLVKTPSFLKRTSANENMKAQTTSTAPSAQSDYTSSDTTKDAGNTLNENKGQAGVNDTSGQSSSNTTSPRTSSTGQITVYLPLDNTIVKSGQELSGTSNLTQVSYRVVDNISGVIGEGTLNVVDGKFSGTLSVKSNATEGRIDVFGTKSDLTEFSNIKIPVRFQ